MISRLMHQGVPGVADCVQPATDESNFRSQLSVEHDPKLREECGVVAIH